MKTQLLKSRMLAACIMLFYGCTPDNEEMADFERMEKAQTAELQAGCEVINFDAGNITKDENGFVSSVTSATGSDKILVSAIQRREDGSYRQEFNVANIFNSARDRNTTTTKEQVDDLLTPHRSFPGGQGVGDGGKKGSRYENDTELGKMMIVNRYDEAYRPYDNNNGGFITFDFSSMGTVNMTSITVLDIDGHEDLSEIILYGPNDLLIKEVSIDVSGSNGKQIIPLNAEGVERMVVYLGPGSGDGNHSTGSGAIDDIIFCRETVEPEPEPEPEGGCTYTQGYWKNHATGKKADPTWGDLDEADFYNSEDTYLEVLRTAPKGGNAYYILAHQFIAAKLNMKNASSTPEVDEAFANAEDYFEVASPKTPYAASYGVTRAELIEWAGILDAYNNGKIGPGHCD